MKATRKAVGTIVATACLAFALTAQAQAPGGQGTGGAGMGAGMGGGMGAGGGWRASQGNTPGFLLMTPQERTEHQAKMGSVRTYGECKAYLDQHRSKMEAKAKEQGKTLTHMRADPCADMKAAGRIR
ncbi:MAG: hypothetical protein WBP72_09310 [Rhodocyclaceae bacterium]